MPNERFNFDIILNFIPIIGNIWKGKFCFEFIQKR